MLDSAISKRALIVALGLLAPLPALAAQPSNIANGESGSGARTAINQVMNTSNQRGIDVKTDFGAIGDGVADDTTALQNAINAAFPGGGVVNALLYFPPGNYLITRALLLTNIVGGQIIGNDATISYAPVFPTSFVDVAVTLSGSPTITGTNTYYANMPITFSGGSLPAEIANGTVFFVRASGLSGSSFSVSAAPGGAAVSYTGTGSGTASFFLPAVLADGFGYSTLDGIGIQYVAPTALQDISCTFSGSPTITGNNNFTAGMPVVFIQNLVAVPTAFTYFKVYYVIAAGLTSTTFQLSATQGGSAITYTGTGNTNIVHLVPLNVIGFCLSQSGNNGYSGGCKFAGGFSGLWVGLLAGVGPNCDDCIVFNTQFNQCALAGLRLLSFNTLNWSVYGGGATVCGYASTFVTNSTGGNFGASYSIVSGSIALIAIGMSNASYGPDVVYNGSQGLSVICCRSESSVSIVLSGSSAHIAGMIYGSGGSAGTWIDCSLSGIAHVSGCEFSPNNSGGGTGKICALGNQGIFISDGLNIQNQAASYVFTGASTSRIYMRGTNWGVTPNVNLFAGYTGLVCEFDLVQNITVSNLTTKYPANAKFTGLRGWVNDGNVAMASNYGTDVSSHGGGSTMLPVICDGTGTPAWRIG